MFPFSWENPHYLGVSNMSEQNVEAMHLEPTLLGHLSGGPKTVHINTKTKYRREKHEPPPSPTPSP